MLKGSSEAKAWARKMLLSRMKKASVRTAGRLTEKAFFGPRGIFAKAGHVKHLKRDNPQRERYSNFTWDQIVKYLAQEGWKPLGRKNTFSFGRVIGKTGLDQALQLEAQVWRVLYRSPLYGIEKVVHSLGTYKNLDSALIAANRQANDYVKSNPGAAWHEGMARSAQYGGMRSRESIEKALYKGMQVAHEDSAGAARKLHMNKARERQVSSLARRKILKNPLAVFGLGNPGAVPKRINCAVAGVLYRRCVEVVAECFSNTKEKPAGIYYHPFTKKSGVQVLALDNGGILVHSTRGVNLWEHI